MSYEKFISIRSRLVDDFNHHIAAIGNFTEQSLKTLVGYREVALEKTMKDFSDVLCELDKMSNYHKSEKLKEMATENRSIPR